MPIRMKVPGTDFMRRAVQEAERASERAQKRTIRKTAQWAGRKSARELARANRVPLRAIHRRRPGKAGRLRWTIRDEGANVWLGTQPVKASYLGTLKQQRNGARAGRHTFPGSFIATMRSGHAGIFRRARAGEVTSNQKSSRGWTKGRPRTSSRNLPIIAQTVPLENADEVRAGVYEGLPARYREFMRQETRFEALKWEGKFGR